MRLDAAGSATMWTLYDMDSGEVLAAGPASPAPVARPLPLYAPGATASPCPLAVVAGSPPRLPREVVLSPIHCPVGRRD